MPNNNFKIKLTDRPTFGILVSDARRLHVKQQLPYISNTSSIECRPSRVSDTFRQALIAERRTFYYYNTWILLLHVYPYDIVT